ncbi:MAG: von Willebrand factor type A domain-containing protein [Pseudomonadota bacterium]
MNMNPLEQLRDLTTPVPDPAARLRAKRAAMAEFRRLHAVEERKPATSKWSWKSPWLGGFATASVVVVGLSLAWFVPQDELKIQPPARAASEVPPAFVAPAKQTSEPVQQAARSAPRAVAQAPATAQGQAAATAPDVVAESSAPATPVPAKAEDNLEEVMITGTRIQVAGNSAVANPITSVTAEEMRQLGKVRLGDALRQLVPQNVSAYSPTVTGQGQTGGAASSEDRNGFFVGNTIANLRGLDPAFGSRTLTLVDGRRMVSMSNQADVIDMAGVVGVIQPNGAITPAVPPPPQVTGTFEQFEINAAKRVADEPESTFSIDVDTASYSFARRILNQGRLPAMDAVRVEEMINYFDYSWPAPTSKQEPLRPTIAVSDSPWGKGKKLIHIGIKGYELPARGKPDANLVFLLDVSGSMNSQDRLPLAIQSMKLLLDSLKPTDTVGIVVYAGAAGQVLAPTPVRNREVIERALDSLRAGGSTAGAQGIQLAYQLAERSFRDGGVNRIFLATDGDFNVGVVNRNELKGMVERERTKGIYLSVLGFGQGNTRDDIAQTLAQNGNGVAAYIDTLQEARKVLVDEASASLFTIANDVKIQVEFNPATVAEYRLIGYETRALNREDFNNDKVDAGEIGSGHSVTAIYEITPVGSGAQLIDERRYAETAKVAGNAQGKSNEYGYLKIRYKLPGESESHLMQRPIPQNAGVPAAVRQDVAFSTAVAGFGQLLRGGRYTGSLSYDDVIRQAESARGQDEFGYRAEFVQLARKASNVRSPLCDAIQVLDARIAAERDQVSQLLQRLDDRHPDVLAAKARLAGTEATKAAEVARAATVDLTCRTTGALRD